MTITADKLSSDGFVHVANVRVDEHEGYAFDYEPTVGQAKNVVYVAIQGDEVLYVGRAKSFRSRYGYGHVRWLRGEKRNSERQRQRWVKAIERGPIAFYARMASKSLDTEEREFIAALRPALNVG